MFKVKQKCAVDLLVVHVCSRLVVAKTLFLRRAKVNGPSPNQDYMHQNLMTVMWYFLSTQVKDIHWTLLVQHEYLKSTIQVVFLYLESLWLILIIFLFTSFVFRGLILLQDYLRQEWRRLRYLGSFLNLNPRNFTNKRTLFFAQFNLIKDVFLSIQDDHPI